jgi:xylulokinase
LGLIGETEQQAISLGTSDTYFGYLPELMISDRGNGHIFGAADGNYMALICFRNGSLAREAIKNRFDLSWEEFSNLLLDTPPGNTGQIMLPYFSPEITPLVLSPRVWRFGGLSESDKAGNVRAIAEAQVMSMYLHSEWMGTRPQTILVTAGGSENRGLLKVISQVFNAEVRAFEVKDSAALGAAIRAAHCYLNHQGETVSWRELTDPHIKDKVTLRIMRDEDASRVYHGENGLLEIYKTFEQHVLGTGEDPEEKIKRFKETNT